MYLAINLRRWVDKVGLKPVKLLLDESDFLIILWNLSVYLGEVSSNHGLHVNHLLFVIDSDLLAGAFELISQLLVTILKSLGLSLYASRNEFKPRVYGVTQIVLEFLKLVAEHREILFTIFFK